MDHGGGHGQHDGDGDVGHFVPTAPSVYSKLHVQSSNSHAALALPSPSPVTTSAPLVSVPAMENTRAQLDLSKAKQVMSIINTLNNIMQKLPVIVLHVKNRNWEPS